jgi:glucan phosphoethanolaminetransferase (alkaline phosphatase superfamily)
MLPLLATAAATPLEKLHNVSGQFWIKVLLVFLVLAVIVAVLKWLSGVNRIFMIIIGCVVIGVFGFTWIYERNEPAFLTPIIDPIANSGFFPSKGAYGNKQKQDVLDHKNAPATPTPPVKK